MCDWRPLPSAPVGIHRPIAGSYSSTLFVTVLRESSPPATSTWPEGSSVAVWRLRPVLSGPVDVHFPVAWSYSSLAARGPPGQQLGDPPAISTWPEGSSVAVWSERAVPRSPVEVHRPVAGSYSSAL